MRFNDRGTATVELVLLTPLILVILMLVVAAGRLGTIQGQLAGAARDAARSASHQPTFELAEEAARTTAEAVLAERSVPCVDVVVELGPETVIAAGGQVSVLIDCVVPLSDLAVPGLPGTRVVGASSIEAIDHYRWIG